MGLQAKRAYLQCCSCVIEERTCCGPARCLPNQTCQKPLPESLRITVSGTYSGPFGGGACECLALDSTLTFYSNGFDNPHNGLPNVWAGTFTSCGVKYRYSLGCVEGSLGWRMSFQQGDINGNSPTNCLASSVFHPDGILMVKRSCDLLDLDGLFTTSGIGCCGPSHLVGAANLDIHVFEELP